MRITVEGHNYKTTYEVEDSHINDLIYIFRSILALDTYSLDMIEEHIKIFEG
jgi:hypothetical protein